MSGNKNKHTPGVWINRIDKGAFIVREIVVECELSDTGVIYIADVFGGLCEWEDNARLISAAPDMYAALKAQEEADRLWDIGFSDPDNGVMLEHLETWLNTEIKAKALRKAAIEKADGNANQ
jgi:hypothetical protein